MVGKIIAYRYTYCIYFRVYCILKTRAYLHSAISTAETLFYKIKLAGTYYANINSIFLVTSFSSDVYQLRYRNSNLYQGFKTISFPRITGYENTVLGLSSKLEPLLRKKLKTNKDAMDVLSFGEYSTHGKAFILVSVHNNTF